MRVRSVSDAVNFGVRRPRRAGACVRWAALSTTRDHHALEIYFALGVTVELVP